MHALGRFIQDLMDGRSMTRPELERASGLSRQHIHQLLDDRKTALGRMVDDTTVAALARAFPDVGETAFIARAAESLGVPVDRLAIVDVDYDRLSDEALLGILAKRLARLRAQETGRTDARVEPPLAARRSRRVHDRISREGDDDAETPSH